MQTRKIAALGIFTLLAGVAVSHAAEPRPTFDAADVHVAPQSINRFMRGGNLHGTRYEIHNASMIELIAEAYDLDSDRIFGGPSWVEMDRFDVIANAPAKTPPDTLKLMLQSLLEERFKLTLRVESKPLPAYALVVAKHVEFKEPSASGQPGCRQSAQRSPDAPDGAGPTNSITIVMSCHSVTLATLVDELPIPQKAGEVSREVVDQTGLKGVFDFDLKFTLGGDGVGPVSDALERQLGLKLEATTLPSKVMQLEKVNRQPTPNSPEEMKLFPPLPTEFEVAEIKPAKPSTDGSQPMVARGGIVVMGRGGRGGGGPVLQNGRVNMQGYTLKMLVELAWDVTNDDLLSGAPKWMDTDRFDVIAKVPDGPAADAFTDMDSIKPLLRTLLLDKFKMAVHTEERQMNGWMLTATKPKLKPADPSGRTKWINGQAVNGKDPRNGNPAVGRLVTCQNMTMPQFAEILPAIASGYLRGSTVLDRTGLDGVWDFTFYFSAAGQVDGGGRGLRGGDMVPATSGTAVDPSGGLSLYDSLTKLLGLKLEQQKRPMPVLVIDRVDQKPTEN